MECANYRPISLINADIKIFSKVLASRLETVIGKLISPDQSGFLKGRLAADNVRRLLHILSATGKIPRGCGLLFVDAQQAFDRLEFPYLWKVLEKFKFGERYINMIRTLYVNPSARVNVGGGFSELFDIRRGVRQGDPISPLIFNLSIEPMAQLIRSCVRISPITVGDTSHSISLYADDTLVYMADVQRSLPVVLEILNDFGYLSGYKVNLSKSALMLVNIDRSEVTIPPQLMVTDEVTYLGIKISPSLSTIAKTNYSLVSRKIEDDINRWKHLPSSVPARIAVVKMNILPRVNFISSMIPLAPPVGYWKRLDTLLRKYIWNGKKPAIKWSVLQYRKSGGGWTLPNFKLYHWSFVLRSLNVWLDNDNTTSWKGLEWELLNRVRTPDFLLMGISTRKCDLYYGPIFSSLLQVFRAVEKFVGYESKWCKSSPLWNNNNLLSDRRPFVNRNWEQKGIRTLQDINGSVNILDFGDLLSKYGIDRHSLFFYFRVRSACRAYRVP